MIPATENIRKNNKFNPKEWHRFMTVEQKIHELLAVHGAVLKRRKKHEVWQLPNGKTFVKASTPSDTRSAKNSLRDLRKVLELNDPAELYPGGVCAFEPNPSLTSNLLRTAAGIPQLKVLDCALADMPGEMQFFVPEDHQMGSLRNWTKQGTVRMVPVRTLDQLPSQPEPDLVKMDVEGAELLVLRGAERWWSALARPPIVFFEQVPQAAAAFGYEATEVQRWFRERGLRIFEMHYGGLRPLERVYEGAANLLAVPECRMDRL